MNIPDIRIIAIDRGKITELLTLLFSTGFAIIKKIYTILEKYDVIL